MVENTTAVENINEILCVEGLDFVVIGPADLSVSMGHPLDDSHPDIQQTIKNIQQTAKEADIPVGQLASSTDEAKELINDDVQIIRISGGEIAALRSVVETRFDKLTEYTTDKWELVAEQLRISCNTNRNTAQKNLPLLRSWCLRWYYRLLANQ